MVQIDLGERLIRLADKVLSENSNETIGHTGGITNATANDTYVPTTKAVKEYVDDKFNDIDYGTFTELQTIINDAQNGDTIVLEKDYQNNGNENCIEIEKTLKIVGNGHIIDANKHSVIFEFSYEGSNTILDNITFLNGEKEYYNGAAIRGSYITVTNCNFINCKAAYNGGAISGTHLKIYNSSFINCRVENEDDADAEGGAIYSGQGMEVVNCIFLNNSAAGTGAAIWYGGNDYSQGGVLHPDNSYISNCIFEDNVAQNGYGLYSEDKNINAYNCIFENTTTYNFTNVDYSAGRKVVTSWEQILSDEKVPSERLVKEYVDDLIGNVMQYIQQ